MFKITDPVLAKFLPKYIEHAKECGFIDGGYGCPEDCVYFLALEEYINGEKNPQYSKYLYE